MDDPLWWWVRWGYYVVWAAGGLALLACYRRHARASRRGLAGVALAGVVATLNQWVNELQAAAGRPAWGLNAFIAATSVLHTLSYLLLAWAVVTDRPPPADADEPAGD